MIPSYRLTSGWLPRALRWCWTAILALLVTTATGCVSWRAIKPVPVSTTTSQRLSRQGVSAMEMGRWDEAESLLREAVDNTPDDSDTRCHLAEALWQRGAVLDAIGEITAAADLDPQNATTAVRAGEMLLAMGQAEAAAERAAAAIRLDHDMATAWFLRGRASAVQGNTDRALADYQRALLLSPNATDILHELAWLHHRRNDHRRCLVTLHRLLDSYPPDCEPPEILILEGETYLALERPSQASERLALAASRAAPTADLRVLQAQAELALGRLQPAEELARDALAMNHQHEGANQMLLRLGQRVEPGGSRIR